MTNLVNRDDLLGLITNIILAISFAALANAIIFLLGWNRAGTQLVPSFAPPDYVVGIAWLFLFAFMGTARWLVIKSKSEEATYHSRIVVFLIVFCFVYPFYTLAINSSTTGSIGNIATILIAGWSAYQIKSSSKTAAALIFTIVLWVSFATAVVICSIQLDK